MKVRYVKADDAPEGLLRIAVANDEYKLDDNEDHRSFEVDDVAVQNVLDEMAQVKRAGTEDSEAAQRREQDRLAREVAKAERERAKAQAKADKHNAEKAPEEAAKTAEDFLAQKQEGKD